MTQPETIVTVEGPTAPASRPAASGAVAAWSGIMYSVQLANGLIVTSPDKFPAWDPSSLESEEPIIEVPT